MKIFSLLNEIKRRDKLLYIGGCMMLVITLLMLVPLAFDNRLILGINPWIKPIKFSLSIAIYVFTVAWFLHYIKEHTKTVKWISRATAISMFIEMGILILQSARGVASHFNESKLIDGVLFGIMGLLIGLTTIMIIVYGVTLMLKSSSIHGPYKSSVLLGILVFLAASWVGGVMIQNGAHAVGAQDGGQGIPFFNWSLDNGDLRVAHFFGLHALQIIPFCTFAFLRMLKKTKLTYLALAFLVVVYTSVFYFLYSQAMAGIPLFSFQ